MSEGHRFLSDAQLDGVAHAPGYPKIPNVAHDRKEIDHDAVLAFMPTGEPMTSPDLTAFKIYSGLRDGDEQFRWTVTFTLPALFARVRNLEAQVLAEQAQGLHWQREIEVLVSQRNAPFNTDRRAGSYRLQIRETSTMEDRMCFGLPTVLHVQSYVPRSGHFAVLDGDMAVYEGKYVLMEDHRGNKAGTYAAESEKAIEALASHLPVGAREDPSIIVEQAISNIQGNREHLKALADLEGEAAKLVKLLAKAQTAIVAARKGKAVQTNLKTLDALVSTVLDRLIDMQGEDGVPDEMPSHDDLD